MARQPQQSVDPRVEAARQYLEGVAKKLADDLFGARGPAWNTTLTELEEIALQTREVLGQKLLQLGLERQAGQTREARPAAMQACPDCQRAFSGLGDTKARSMASRAGPVAWDEPEEYCPRCRRAFFPSEQESGH